MLRTRNSLFALAKIWFAICEQGEESSLAYTASKSCLLASIQPCYEYKKFISIGRISSTLCTLFFAQGMLRTRNSLFALAKIWFAICEQGEESSLAYTASKSCLLASIQPCYEYKKFISIGRISSTLCTLFFAQGMLRTRNSLFALAKIWFAICEQGAAFFSKSKI